VRHNNFAKLRHTMTIFGI